MRKRTWKKRLVCGVCGTSVLALLLAAFPAIVMAQPSIQAFKVALDVNGGAVMNGDVISYIVTITNTGDAAQVDDPALPELVDPIPAHAIYVPGTATANSGTATYNIAQNRIEWNGAINTGVANSVVVQFSVVIFGTTAGDVISNQGTVNWGLRRQRHFRCGGAHRRPRHRADAERRHCADGRGEPGGAGHQDRDRYRWRRVGSR